MNDVEQIVQKQWEALPENIQQAIRSAHVEQSINDIAKSRNLHVDKAGDLRTSVMLLLFGLVSTEEFIPQLIEDLGISRSEAEIIARDIDVRILSPIRDSLRDVQKMLQEADRKAGEKPAEKKMEEVRLDLSTSSPHPEAQSEGPIPNLRTMPKDVARLKLEQSIRMPKEEIEMRYKEEQGGKKGGDPYRELPQ